MRSLLEISARTDRVEDLADWVEISTFFNDDKSVSEEDLARALVRAGGNRGEGEARDKASAAFAELSDRAAAMAHKVAEKPVAAYPFQVDGDLLTRAAEPLDAPGSGLLYTFLLVITRASMESRSRRLNGIDPTTLFEDVCAHSLREFWGGKSELSDVFVTGTSNKAIPAGAMGRFPQLINLLAKHLHEGGGWRKGARSPGAGDGGLDLAVWRKFPDKRPGGLIGFAQCKTGDNWRMHLGRHNPRSVCQRFFRARLVLDPMPVYMVPCRVAFEEWEQVMEEHTGILFDRCRIAHFATHLPVDCITSCKSWLKAAIDREMAILVKKGLKPVPVAAPSAGAAT